MENAAPPAALTLSHDLQWSLTPDPANRELLRLAQYRSTAPDPEGSIELAAEDLPQIRNWLRGVLFAAEWPPDREFAGAGILQMIPRPRPELYLERLSPGRGRFGPGYSLPRDAREQPGVYQRLCLYEPDIRLIVNWLSAWSAKLYGESSQNWLVEERPPRTPEERAAEDDFWDDIDATPEPPAPAPTNVAEGSAALPTAESPSLDEDEPDEDEEVSTELAVGIREVPSEHGAGTSLQDHLDPSRGTRLSISRGPDPDRLFTLKEVREIMERERQGRRNRIRDDVIMVLYVFGLPLLALWLWELAKRGFRWLF